MQRMKKHAVVWLTMAMSGAALVSVSTGGSAAGVEPKRLETNFAMQAKGWSTRLQGGEVPVYSGPTGVALLGCTRLAGLDRGNNTAAVNLPAENPSVHVGATETRAWTTKGRAGVASNALNTVADVLVGDPAQQALLLEGVRTRARTWHDSDGFHRKAQVTVVRATHYVGGVAQERGEIPPGEDLSGETLEIPGLVNATFGIKAGRVSNRQATSRVMAVQLELLPSGSTLSVGRAIASIRSGAVSGVMSGASWGSKLSGVGGVVNSGRTALKRLPCHGTNGRWIRNEAAEVTIGELARLNTVEDLVLGDQDRRSAVARGASRIDRVVFDDRNLVLTAIEGRGLVRRYSDGRYVRKSTGTTLGSIRHDGQRQQMPDPGETLVIPNVARITPHRVTKLHNGIKVSAVQVQLLQGSEVQSTLRLGNTVLRVRRH